MKSRERSIPRGPESGSVDHNLSRFADFARLRCTEPCRSYVVAKENLGTPIGLIAAAALVLDDALHAAAGDVVV